MRRPWFLKTSLGDLLVL